jgi:SAM-dependent methyltransferase
MFDRTAHDRFGGLARRCHTCDDYDIYLRIARGFPVFCHDEVVAEYRWRGSNSSLENAVMLDTTLRPVRGQRRWARTHLPSEAFDCIIFTETLHLLYDFRAGLRTLHRMLKPGGVLLVTFPGITIVARPDDRGNAWFWSFTELSARRVFEETFPGSGLAVEARGNVLSATAFLWGLATSELEPDELSHRDPEYPVTIGVRAVKSGGVPQ